MIMMRGITRTFGKGDQLTYAARDVDLDVSDGDFLTIMGPSGCGKSTLLSILGMLDSAWRGTYVFDGTEVHGLKPKKRVALNREYIGFVFQRYHLLDGLTVQENLEVPLTYRNIKGRERSQLVDDHLERFGIAAKRNMYPANLSGGVQQLIGIVRAIIASPRVILADEPTGNLHSTQAQEIMELFRELNQQGTTIIQVTHAEQNATYGKRTVEMLDGTVSSQRTEP